MRMGKTSRAIPKTAELVSSLLIAWFALGDGYPGIADCSDHPLVALTGLSSWRQQEGSVLGIIYVQVPDTFTVELARTCKAKPVKSPRNIDVSWIPHQRARPPPGELTEAA
jgi:hypothetical protein